MKQLLTLVIIYDDEKILLGMKKRGFGAGRWNGFGGKVLEGEGIEESAKRELEEECGIVANDLVERGRITFTFADSDGELEVYIFRVNSYSGEPIETEEMKPQWFLHKDIPYEEMWKDDPFWLPHVLQGKNVRGIVHFDNAKTQNILRNTIEAYD